jgi:hypothetical protein
VRLQTQLPVTNNTNKSPIALHINQPVNVSSATNSIRPHQKQREKRRTLSYIKLKYMCRKFNGQMKS